MVDFTASTIGDRGYQVSLFTNIYKFLYIMLPKVHLQCYQSLHALLEDLQRISGSADLDGMKLRSVFEQVQQLFAHGIMGLTFDELDPADAFHMQSYLTEIHKQLRLLNMDVMFLQAARQPATAKQRQAQISDRLKLLMGYCEAIANI